MRQDVSPSSGDCRNSSADAKPWAVNPNDLKSDAVMRRIDSSSSTIAMRAFFAFAGFIYFSLSMLVVFAQDLGLDGARTAEQSPGLSGCAFGGSLSPNQYLALSKRPRWRTDRALFKVVESLLATILATLLWS